MTSPRINVAANRKARKWSRGEQIKRIFWAVAQPFFQFSPRLLWGWRRALLRVFGAKIGRDVHIFPTVRITMPWNLTIGDEVGIGDRVILYALGAISICDRATVSQGAHLCAGSHDWRDPAMPLTKPPITIGPDVWVCADAFIGPGVTVGEQAIVGARSVVVSDIPANTIAAGNPAQVKKRRS